MKVIKRKYVLCEGQIENVFSLLKLLVKLDGRIYATKVMKLSVYVYKLNIEFAAK